MIISLCMITIGDSELESLKRAVASVAEYVDEVYITTNGKDYILTEGWCEENKYHHSHMDWDDNFAKQRNFNFSQVRSDTDFIVWMDTDDVIIGADRLRDVAKISKESGYQTVFFTYWYGNKFDGEPSPETFVEVELTQTRERLIKPGVSLWKGRLHETPLPTDPNSWVYTRVPYSKENPIVWMHLGADRDGDIEVIEAKTARNRRLLELQLQDERKVGQADPRTLLYLMKIYAESDGGEILKDCIEMGKEYLEGSGWDEERATCCQLMARCMGKLGDHNGAKQLLHNAIEEYPYSPLMYLHLARAYFNLGNLRAMEHWMKLGLSLEVKETSSMNNLLELKVLSSELALQLHNAKRDVRRAYSAAKALNKLNPTPENQHNEDYLFDQAELDKASEHAHKYMEYLLKIQQEPLIEKFYKAMPQAMQSLPFANRYYNRYKKPRKWGEKEICYFANFGMNSIEKWDGRNLVKGIGGSETAVIRLAEEWTKLGYKVTVYGDPAEDIVVNGVTYLPYYKFNIRDHFNIFIQWRNNNLCDKIKCKKFLVDLHDVFGQNIHVEHKDQIDKLMVKSQFHREYAPDMPDDKVCVISNGIDE